VSTNDQFDVQFRKSGRGQAQCPPDPNYPEGKAIRLQPEITRKCEVLLPYPAPECGMFYIFCNICNLHVAVTAAGRPDDPISIELPCAEPKSAGRA